MVGAAYLPVLAVAAYNGTFIGAPIGVVATLLQSDAVQSGTSTFVENGAQMRWLVSDAAPARHR